MCPMKTPSIPTQHELSRIIENWAQTQKNVKAVWLYGSRIQESGKQAHAESDWDVAIQFDGDNPEQIRFDWFNDMDRIQKELDELIGWEREHRDTWEGIHLEIYNPPETEHVSKAVCTYAICVYSKW